MPKMPKVMELSATASNFQITIPRIAGSNFKQYPNLKYQSKTMQRHNSSIGYYFVSERKLGFFVQIKEDVPLSAGLTAGIH